MLHDYLINRYVFGLDSAAGFDHQTSEVSQQEVELEQRQVTVGDGVVGLKDAGEAITSHANLEHLNDDRGDVKRKEDNDY